MKATLSPFSVDLNENQENQKGLKEVTLMSNFELFDIPIERL